MIHHDSMYVTRDIAETRVTPVVQNIAKPSPKT